MNKWNIPDLEITVREKVGDDSDALFEWKVKLMAPDEKAARMLGYCASGTANGDGNITFSGSLQVHDENRDVWTPMNPGDRKDVRAEVEAVMQKALAHITKLRSEMTK
jgi:hypothetical protein